MKHQHLGQELFVLAPPVVALANRDEHFHQQGAVQVVHELDELLAGLRQQGGVLAGGQLAAGDIQVPALAQELAKLRRQIGELERWHGAYYRGPAGRVAR